MKCSTLMILAILAAAVLAWPQAAKIDDPWTGLNFFIGEWQGMGTGTPGEAVGGTSFAFSLDKKILVRKNWAKYPPKPGENAGLSHEDLMIIYPAGPGTSLRAVYFDNEGHVIQYAARSGPAAGSVVFETDASQPGPRFRLAYEMKPDGTLDNVFSIAPPGGEFKVYARGVLKKKG